MFKTIVVGVDGREGGRDALSLAGRLALVAGGDLVAVRVLSFDYYASRAGAPPYSSPTEHDARTAVEAELDRAGLDARVVIAGDTSPARALHRVAEGEHADVIVVGSTHHGRAGRVFAGDDAVAALQGSPCAVAVRRADSAVAIGRRLTRSASASTAARRPVRRSPSGSRSPASAARRWPCAPWSPRRCRTPTSPPTRTTGPSARSRRRSPTSRSCSPTSTCRPRAT